MEAKVGNVWIVSNAWRWLFLYPMTNYIQSTKKKLQKKIKYAGSIKAWEISVNFSSLDCTSYCFSFTHFVNKFIACNGGTIYLDRMNECEREREEARKNVAFKFESCLKLPNAHTYTHIPFALVHPNTNI